MAHINIDERTFVTMQSDDVVKALKLIIHNELKKDEKDVNTELIDECVDALLEIEQDRDKSFAILIPLASATDYLNKIKGKRISFKNMNIFARTAVVAAVLAATGITANAAIETVTGVNVFEEIGNAIYERFSDAKGNKEEPEQTEPAAQAYERREEKTTHDKPLKPSKPGKPKRPSTLPAPIEVSNAKAEATTEPETEEVTTVAETEPTAEPETEPVTESAETETQSTSTTKRQNKPTVTKRFEPTTVPKENDGEEEIDAPVITDLRAEFDGFKYDYIYGEELTYDGLTLTAVYSDKSEKKVSLDECRYTKSLNMNVTADYTLKIVYQSFTVTIDITVRPDEDTRGGVKKDNGIFEYMLTDKGAYVTKYKGTALEVDASKTDGNKIFAIGASVFENSEVTSVYAPNTVKIFENAFKNAKSLELCTAPNAEHIGNEAFKGASSLKAASFNTESCLLGDGAYAQSGIESITLPKNEAVPKSLCEECEALTEVNLNGAEEIGERAFNACPKLESITGAGNVKTVGSFAFYSDEKAVLDEAPELESVADNAFAYCKKMNLGDITDKLKSVGEYAFMYCAKIRKAEISESVKEIPLGAFWGTHLVSLKLPEGLEKIGDAAFMSTMLTSVTIPENVKSIGSRAFDTATMLKVYFDGSPAKIEQSAFFKSKRLTFYAYHFTSPAEFAIENEIKLEYLDEIPYYIDTIVDDDE